MVGPGSAPCPRRQHILTKTLYENASPAEDGVTVKSPCHDDEPDRPAGYRQIGQAAALAAVNPFQRSPATGTVGKLNERSEFSLKWLKLRGARQSQIVL